MAIPDVNSIGFHCDARVSQSEILRKHPVRCGAPAVQESRLSQEKCSSADRRLSEKLYRYESAGGQFVADISVDEAGMIVDYGNSWSREIRAADNYLHQTDASLSSRK